MKGMVVLFSCLAGGLTSLNTVAVSAGNIELSVYGEHRDGKVIYHYAIENRTNRTLYNFTIGVARSSQEEIQETGLYFYPQLASEPTGTQIRDCGEVGCDHILLPESVSQPTGWYPLLFGQEHISWRYLEWKVSSKYTTQPHIAAVSPGETVEGFSVVLPKRDESYVRKDGVGVPVGFAAEFGPSGPMSSAIDHFGQVKLLDTTPPELSLSANPSALWPPNGKLADITVDVRARDDYDGRPEVVLESITANEPLQEGDIEGADYGQDDRMFRLAAKRAGASADGRIYTITYSATDAVGNRSEKTVTVTVPHDRR